MTCRRHRHRQNFLSLSFLPFISRRASHLSPPLCLTHEAASEKAPTRVSELIHFWMRSRACLLLRRHRRRRCLHLTTTTSTTTATVVGNGSQLQRPLSSSTVSFSFPSIPSFDYQQQQQSRSSTAAVPQNAAQGKHLRDLETAVKSAVDRHLQTSHRELFEITSMKELKRKIKSRDIPRDVVERLAALNGYQKVETPGHDEFVRLAQGIVARPGFYPRQSRFRRRTERSIKYSLYSQPIISPKVPQKVPSIDVLPPLVEKDITIYRILENNVEDVLTSIGDTLDELILKPLERIQKFLQPDDEKKDASHVMQEDYAAKNHSEENLLVLSDHNMAIITDMKPSLRLLALPFELGHNGASTLISCSVVVFGAIPVAYRSMNFALEYPGLAQVIKLSVISTICYGIWSNRSISRTQQSQVVANGLARRVYARDDAVLLVLQEGAKQKTAEGVLGIYHRIRRKTASQDYADTVVSDGGEVSPLEIAKELGLVIESEDGRYGAVPLESAVSLLAEDAGKL